LAVAVIGVYSAFSIVVILTLDNSDRFTAAYLAQEGIEIVRNIRDSNWVLGQEEWNAGFVDRDQGIEVDYLTRSGNEIQPWIGDGNYLNIDVRGFYSYDTGPESKFKRKITIKHMSQESGGAMLVSVEVTWQKNATILSHQEPAGACGELNCVKMEEYMYDWY